jgi:DNA-binding response OmpR family regulator
MGTGQPDLLLVVDDSDAMRELLERQLAERGYEVVTAADGERALELVAARRPDAILLDHELPGMSGLEVLGRLRSDDKLAAMPVIMLTSEHEQSLLLTSLRAGAHDHLRKPFDPAELEARVAAALRAERLAQLNVLKRLAARGKSGAALAWIEDFLASDEPLVVFCGNREVQELALARFPDALHLVGSDSAQAREEAVRAFQEPDGPQLLIASTRIGGHGITLTRASNVAFLDLEWTPAMHDQAEDRCHRIGQHDAVTAWYLLAAETIDETMIELIARKRGIVGAVTDGRRDESEALVQSVVRELRGGVPRRRLRVVA